MNYAQFNMGLFMEDQYKLQLFFYWVEARMGVSPMRHPHCVFSLINFSNTKLGILEQILFLLHC